MGWLHCISADAGVDAGSRVDPTAALASGRRDEALQAMAQPDSTVVPTSSHVVQGRVTEMRTLQLPLDFVQHILDEAAMPGLC